LAKGIGLGRLDGAGNFRPYTHWPPLYPILLAIPHLMGLDSMESARMIGALCIMLLIMVTGLALSRLTDHSPFFTAGALIILINAPNLWDTSLFAMTEPLYMVFGLSALLLLDGYLNNFKGYLLILSSLLAGLALVTRYVGFSLIAASLLVVLIQKERSWSQKIRDSFVMMGFSMFPFIFWMIRNTLVAGTSTNRTLALIPFTPGELQKAVSAMNEWVNAVIRMSPVDWLKPALLFTVAFLMAIIYFKFIPTQSNSRRNWFWALLLVYALSYTFITIMARLLFDQYIPLFEPRIQYPLFTGIFLLLIFGLYQLQEHLRATGWLLPAILTGLYVLGAWSYARGYTQFSAGGILAIGHNNGLGMVWSDDDPLLPVLDQFSLQEYRLFTDNIEKLYFISSLYSYQLLSTQNTQVDRIFSELDDRGVILVIFDNRSWGPDLQFMIPGLELIYSGTADVYRVFPK
jgi:4-amino-4-deoxy-L-arabinose transferase-like glycosyltransferase